MGMELVALRRPGLDCLLQGLANLTYGCVSHQVHLMFGVLATFGAVGCASAHGLFLLLSLRKAQNKPIKKK